MRIFNDKRAAVSLTYDDGMNEHLDQAMPHLEEAGFRGTFFIATRRGDCFSNRRDEWARAASRGHELGNHTQHHPCPQRTGEPNPRSSENYTQARIEQELLDAERDLNEIAPAPTGSRSFAFPCGCTWVGPDRASYRHIAARHFAACRGGASPDDPQKLRNKFFNGRGVTDTRPQETIVQAIDETIEQGGWLILIFHGIETGWLSLTAQRHQQLLRIAASRSRCARCAFRGSGRDTAPRPSVVIIQDTCSLPVPTHRTSAIRGIRRC